MKPKENDNQTNQHSQENLSPVDRIETPSPAQEIYPVERAMNDARQTEDRNLKKSKKDGNENQ
jgi:hypothetical protein